MNWVQINSTNQPLILNGEIVIHQYPTHLELVSGNEYPGNGGCYYADGILYLTNLRLIFISISPSIFTYSIPFIYIKEEIVKKPIFSSSYFFAKIKNFPESGLVTDGKLNLSFESSSILNEFFSSFSSVLSEARSILSNSNHPSKELLLMAGQHFSSQNNMNSNPNPNPWSISNYNSNPSISSNPNSNSNLNNPIQLSQPTMVQIPSNATAFMDKDYSEHIILPLAPKKNNNS